MKRFHVNCAPHPFVGVFSRENSVSPCCTPLFPQAACFPGAARAEARPEPAFTGQPWWSALHGTSAVAANSSLRRRRRGASQGAPTRSYCTGETRTISAQIPLPFRARKLLHPTVGLLARPYFALQYTPSSPIKSGQLAPDRRARREGGKRQGEGGWRIPFSAYAMHDAEAFADFPSVP